jgi:hypothetical protein
MGWARSAEGVLVQACSRSSSVSSDCVPRKARLPYRSYSSVGSSLMLYISNWSGSGSFLTVWVTSTWYVPGGRSVLTNLEGSLWRLTRYYENPQYGSSPGSPDCA